MRSWTRSALAELSRTEEREKRDDLREQYSCELEMLPPHLRTRFVQLHFDEDTRRFMDDQCFGTSKSWIRSFYDVLKVSVVRPVLTQWYSLTDSNAILSLGQMHVLSTSQFRQMIGGSATSEPQVDSWLDIGAGDGNTTKNVRALTNRLVVTESSEPMCRRLEALNMFDRVVCCDSLAELQNEGRFFQVISILNVLDRCSHPMSLLNSVVAMKPDLVVIAIVFPLHPMVESGPNQLEPVEDITIDNDHFERFVAEFERKVLRPAGLDLIRFSRVDRKSVV